MRLKKIAALALAVCASLGAVGCGKYYEGEKIDPNRTQLYVGFYDGGWGSQWIREMKADFEALNPKVQVMLKGKKDEMVNNNLAATIQTMKEDLFFTTVSPHDMVSQDKLLDITDVVTEPLTEYGEKRSIADKMDGTIKEYMLSSNKEGKYYTIPLYTSYFNMVYDVDLFETGGYYLSEDGKFTTGIGNDPPKSVGQDGAADTLDDGLPVTWDDFKRLLNELKDGGVIPFIWSGKVPSYRTALLISMQADYEGYDNFLLNYTFDGVDTSLGNLEIDSTNGYELQRQPGKKAALEFAKYIIDNNMYHEKSFHTSLTHLNAQDEYLYSKYRETTGEGRRIAMLIEGGWWENEALDTIKTMETKYGDEYKDRRFGIMPVPRFEGSATGKTLWSVTGNSCVFIRKNPTQEALAKAFLRFTTTDENLRRYNRLTGSTRAYDYTLTEEDLSRMSYYKRSLWSVFSDENTKLVYAQGPHPIATANAALFASDWFLKGDWNGKVLSEPFADFKNYGREGLTVDAYFEALQSYYDKSYWNDKILAKL